MRASQSFTTTGPGGVRLLTVDVEPVGQAVMVRARGELDLFTGLTLDEALAAAWALEPTVLTVDLSQVDFLGASAVAIVVGVRAEARSRGTGLEVIGRPGIVDYVLGFAGQRAAVPA